MVHSYMTPTRLNELLDEMSWPVQTLAKLRGGGRHSARRMQRWTEGREDIDPRQAVWLERTYKLIKGMGPSRWTSDSRMTATRFVECVNTLHWCPDDSTQGWPWFGDIIGADQDHIFLMASDMRHVPSVIAEGLEEIMRGVNADALVAPS